MCMLDILINVLPEVMEGKKSHVEFSFDTA